MREGVFEDSIFISQVAVRISVWEFYFPNLNDNVWGFIHKGEEPRVSEGPRRDHGLLDHGRTRCWGWPPDAALANHEPPECDRTSQSTSCVHRGPTNIGPAHDPNGDSRHPRSHTPSVLQTPQVREHRELGPREALWPKKEHQVAPILTGLLSPAPKFNNGPDALVGSSSSSQPDRKARPSCRGR